MTATIACVDVGQGDATVAVDHASGDALLIDCREGCHDRVVDELRQLRFVQLLCAIVTHSQLDHFGGLLDVLEELGELFTGELYFNHDSLLVVPVPGEDRAISGRKLRALLIRAREYGPRLRRAESGDVAETIGTISWRLLAPTFDEVTAAITESDPNLASGVVLLRIGSDVVVVGGDAQMRTWERIASDIPKHGVLRWPHHGGYLGPEPNTAAKVTELLEPAIVIVSVGATNSYGHPTEEFFAATGGRPGRLFCTQATPTCVAGGGRGGVCAGTIRVLAAGDGRPRVVPAVVDHKSVVEAFGNGRCRADAMIR